MMEIVARCAAGQGYAPDAWFSPDSTGGKGRPYPYMIYKNMEALGVMSADSVIKVGDTVSDIREGKNAGVMTVGVIEGSSEMGLTEEEYKALSPEERERRVNKRRWRQEYTAAGADHVIMDLGSGLRG